MPDEVDKGSVVVPADHDRPDRGKLRLVWTRLRSPHPELIPVVFLAGGPGDSGIAWLNHPPFRAAFEKVAESRDVILLDQRGCGQSEQDTSCAPPDFRPGWLRDESAAFEMLADQARQTLQSKPELRPEFYTPWQSAKDLAYVADALGHERIHLWGYSYGTHLAMAALKAIPDRIDRVALCGFEGPDHTYKVPSRVQQQIERLAELAREQNMCDDLIGSMACVHDSLDLHPVPISLADGSTTEVGLFGLQWLVSTWIGVSNRFKDLPALYLSLARQETPALQKAVQGFAKMLARRPAVFYLNDSASGATAGRLSRIEAETSSCLLGNAANFPFPGIRRAWQQADLGDGFREPAHTVRPVLILTGSLDGFTPTDNAIESLSGLPNAIHGVIARAAHNDLLSCPAANRDITRFLSGHDIHPLGYAVEVPKFRQEKCHDEHTHAFK